MSFDDDDVLVKIHVKIFKIDSFLEEETFKWIWDIVCYSG